MSEDKDKQFVPYQITITEEDHRWLLGVAVHGLYSMRKRANRWLGESRKEND